MNIEKETAVLSANVKYLREHYHLTRAEMAGIMGVGLNTLSTLENGEMPKRLKSDSLILLSRHFHLPVNDLLYTELKDI